MWAETSASTRLAAPIVDLLDVRFWHNRMRVTAETFRAKARRLLYSPCDFICIKIRRWRRAGSSALYSFSRQRTVRAVLRRE